MKSGISPVIIKEEWSGKGDASFTFSHLKIFLVKRYTLAKETRGRRKKHDFRLKKGQLITVPFSNGARVTALKFARDNKIKYRTWREGDTLNVLRD